MPSPGSPTASSTTPKTTSPKPNATARSPSWLHRRQRPLLPPTAPRQHHPPKQSRSRRRQNRSFYPLPNQPGQNAEETNNFFNTQIINRENYIHTSRVDHNFTPKNRFFFRWFNQQHDNSTDFLGTITNVDLLDRTAWGLVADDVHIFNPGLLLNVRYGITYESNINRLGPNGIAFPTVQVDGAVYTALSNNGGTRGATNYSTAGATLTKISGRHSTRYGVEYRLQRETAFDYGFAAPQLLFAGTYLHPRPAR